MTLRLIENAWHSVMDERQNAFNSYSLPTAHLMMQLLAWMWSAVFSISLGSYLVFGVTAVAHALLIGAVFITFMVFQNAQQGEER